MNRVGPTTVPAGGYGGGATPVARLGSEAADEDLVAAAQAGERAALELLLRRQYGRLWAVSRQLTGDDADASDATQNAMIAIVGGLPRFDGRSRFSTWAYRVAVNASLDEVRRRRRRPSASLDQLDLPAAEGSDPGLVRMQVDAALRTLPVDFRAAVVLRDLCGLDYAEIGEILEIPPGTVRSRIARGRAALVPLLSHLRGLGEAAGADRLAGPGSGDGGSAAEARVAGPDLAVAEATILPACDAGPSGTGGEVGGVA